MKSGVNVYPGRLLASWSLTEGFAQGLLQLVLPLAPMDQRSLASALVWGFWDWRSYNKSDLKIPLKRDIPSVLALLALFYLAQL